MTTEAQRCAAQPLVEQLDAFEDLIRQRDSARAWAVELEQRNEEAKRLLSLGIPDHLSVFGSAALSALRGEQS